MHSTRNMSNVAVTGAAIELVRLKQRWLNSTLRNMEFSASLSAVYSLHYTHAVCCQLHCSERQLTACLRTRTASLTPDSCCTLHKRLNFTQLQQCCALCAAYAATFCTDFSSNIDAADTKVCYCSGVRLAMQTTVRRTKKRDFSVRCVCVQLLSALTKSRCTV